MVSKAYELKQAYIGGWEVFNWVLWDQTIIANSTTGSSWTIASTNGKIIRPDFMFWWGNGNYSKTTRTVNWQTINIFQCNSSHWNISIWISDANYTNLTSHKYIKLVFDYFNLWADQSNYTNSISFGYWEWIYDSASSSTIGINEYFVWIPFAYNGWYSLEQIIKVSDMSVKSTITDLGNNNKYNTNTYTKTFNKETNTSYIINWWWPRFIRIYNDQWGWPVVCWDIHIYVSD